MVISCPERGWLLAVCFPLARDKYLVIFYWWPAARNDGHRMPSYPFSYQKFSFGNTGRVCKTLQTILRDKKVEFYVTWIRCCPLGWVDEDSWITIVMSLRFLTNCWCAGIVGLTTVIVGVRSRSHDQLNGGSHPIWVREARDNVFAFGGGACSFLSKRNIR